MVNQKGGKMVLGKSPVIEAYIKTVSAFAVGIKTVAMAIQTSGTKCQWGNGCVPIPNNRIDIPMLWANGLSEFIDPLLNL